MPKGCAKPEEPNRRGTGGPDQQLPLPADCKVNAPSTVAGERRDWQRCFFYLLP